MRGERPRDDADVYPDELDAYPGESDEPDEPDEPDDEGYVSEPEHEKHAPFMAHLQELATRLKWCILFVLIGCVVAYLFSEQLFHYLTQPLVDAFEGERRLHFASPVEPFFTYLTISLVGGLILAAPVVFIQLWLFVAPGLYEREKKLVLPFVSFSALFFFGGVAFGYFIVLPLGFKFLLGYAYDQPANFSFFVQAAEWLGTQVDTTKLDVPLAALEPTIMMKDYIGLVSKLLLAFGLIFELPLFIYFLAKIGLVTHRHLIKFFRYFAVIAFLVGAALTPPDIITQVLMALPLVTMYLASTVVAYFVTKRREAAQGLDLEEEGEEGPSEGEAYEAGAEEAGEEEVDPLEELDSTLPDDSWDDEPEP